jgi:hypothetical protein
MEDDSLASRVQELQNALNVLRLEAEGHRLSSRRRERCVCLVLITIAVATAVGANAVVSKTTESEEFSLRSRDGSIRASLAVDSDDMPRLSFFNRQGRVFATLGSMGGSPTMAFLDEMGRVRFSMQVAKASGRPSVVLSDGSRSPRVRVELGDSDSPSVAMSDGNRRMQLAFRVNPMGVPQLALFHERTGKAAISLTRADDGSGVLGFMDENATEKLGIGITPEATPFAILRADGKPKLHLALLKDGSPFMNFYNDQSPRTISIEQRDGAPGLTFFDAAEQPRAMWRLGHEGSPHVTFLDSKSLPRLTHGLNDAGEPHISLFDTAGKLRASLETVAERSDPIFVLRGAEGQVLETLPKR